MGFYDFAGSTLVHSVGGWGALAGALLLGPRIGKYYGNEVRAIPGSNMPMATVGVFLLWMGWFGFQRPVPYSPLIPDLSRSRW